MMSVPTKEEIAALIVTAIRELNVSYGVAELNSPGPETRLWGAKSALDSIGLVNLIADLEEKVSAQYGIDIVIADAGAMSEARSPFRRVDTLAEYIAGRLGEAASR